MRAWGVASRDSCGGPPQVRGDGTTDPHRSRGIPEESANAPQRAHTPRTRRSYLPSQVLFSTSTSGSISSGSTTTLVTRLPAVSSLVVKRLP